MLTRLALRPAKIGSHRALREGGDELCMSRILRGVCWPSAYRDYLMQ
jgi:hypothetical protein